MLEQIEDAVDCFTGSFFFAVLLYLSELEGSWVDFLEGV